MPDLSLRCSVCRSLLDEEDLFCPNCGTEAPKQEQPARAGESGRVATYNFQCSGCGASMSYDASAGSLRCPFCASVELVPQKDAKILSPRRVVPFTVGRDNAVAAMRRWLGRGFFRPGNLAAQAAVVQMQPVYVPYWIFDARTHTHWTADTDQTPPAARAHWYPLAGEHRGSYAGLLIGASGALTPRETADLCPFDLAAGVPPEQVDLDNITVEQFSVPRKYARPLAQGGLEQLESEACTAAYVPGQARNVHANVLIDGMSSEPVLLPVWIMAYRYKDRVYRFLVNGQSGRATGSAPVSWLKVLMIPAIVLAAVLLVVLLFSLFNRSEKPKPRGFPRSEAPASPVPKGNTSYGVSSISGRPRLR
jgi:LSD1 subclass zinc finger protein